MLKTTTTYYSYVGTDKSEKLVVAAIGALKSDIATQIKSISGVKTYTSVPTSLTEGIQIVADLDYVYVIAPTVTLKNASIYLMNGQEATVVTENLGTFKIGTTEYTVMCTPSELGAVYTAWRNNYYWYVGQTDPSKMTKISPIVDYYSPSPGWRITGNSLTKTYNYDSVVYPIVSSPVQLSEWYFALPENSGLGVFDAQNTNYATGTPISTVTFDNVRYNVWKTGKTVKFNAYYIKNK